MNDATVLTVSPTMKELIPEIYASTDKVKKLPKPVSLAMVIKFPSRAPGSIGFTIALTLSAVLAGLAVWFLSVHALILVSIYVDPVVAEQESAPLLMCPAPNAMAFQSGKLTSSPA